MTVRSRGARGSACAGGRRAGGPHRALGRDLRGGEGRAAPWRSVHASSRCASAWAAAVLTRAGAGGGCSSPDQRCGAGLVLGVFLFLGFALQTVGLTYTTPSRSAFITGLYVLLVPFVVLVLFRRVPRVVLAGGGGAGGGGAVLPDRGLSRWARRACPRGICSRWAARWRTPSTSPSRAGTRRGRSVDALVAVQLWVVALLSAAVPALRGSAGGVDAGASGGGGLLRRVRQRAGPASSRRGRRRGPRRCARRSSSRWSRVFAALFSVVLGYETAGGARVGGRGAHRPGRAWWRSWARACGSGGVPGPPRRRESAGGRA